MGLTFRPTARAAPLALLALAALAPAASHAQTEPGRTAKAKAKASQKALRGIPIRYYNAAPRSAEFVGRAVRAWNRARVGSHFVAVPRRDARVVIRAALPRKRCDGLAQIRTSRVPGIRPISRTRDTQIRYGQRTSAAVTLGENCPLPVVRAFVAAHELGHVLGLNHERRRCSVMSPRAEYTNETLKPLPHCSPEAWARLKRELVSATDLRAVRALYPKAPADDFTSSASNESSIGFFGWGAGGLLALAAVALVTRLLRR